jgi:hypothetical protein
MQRSTTLLLAGLGACLLLASAAARDSLTAARLVVIGAGVLGAGLFWLLLPARLLDRTGEGRRILPERARETPALRGGVGRRVPAGTSSR